MSNNNSTNDASVKEMDALLNQFFPGGFTLRDEANAIVALAFRNGPLEDIHADNSSTVSNDLKSSRISDSEMKELMLYACQKIERLLHLKASDPDEYRKILFAAGLQYCQNWERDNAS